MRKFITLFLFTSLFSLHAQWNESFTDGDFFQNPKWIGSTDLYLVSSGQLQLNAASGGSAFLSTSSIFRKGSVWTFSIRLNFNTSSQNYARVYLSSNTSDPSLSTSGYFVNIGGVNDKVSLFKKNGIAATEIIPGESGQLNTSSITLQVKVELTDQNVWRLFVKTGGETGWSLKGEYSDVSLSGGDFFILQSIYTSSNAKNFWFDDIEMAQLADNTPPYIVGIRAIEQRTLSIQFSEAIDISTTTFTSSAGAISSKEVSSDERSVTLRFSETFKEGINYSLTVMGLKDLSRNMLSETALSFVYWSYLDQPRAGDLVISEIMANPIGAKAIHEVEYIELHNNSRSRVDLSGWELYYGDQGVSLGSYLLLPDSFVVIGSNSSISKFETFVPKLAVESFPVLANSGKLLYLKSPQGEVISIANYTDQWYRDDFKAGGGFSLECIDLHNLCGCSDNWKASNSKSGGTPGTKNSVDDVNNYIAPPSILAASLISSDTILLQFSIPMQQRSVELISKYRCTPSSLQVIKAAVASPLAEQVKLVLNRPLTKGEILEITIDTLFAFAGSFIPSTQLKVAQSESPLTNNIIINELLFNPVGNGADFVELYNNSNKIIDLSTLRFSSKKSDGTLQVGIPLATQPTPLFSKEYVVFTTNRAAILGQYHCPSPSAIKELNTLPSLPDTEGNLQLLLANGEQIDALYYSEKMHHPFLKNSEGISLERINPNRSTSEGSNWQSASTLSGGATPGYINSQQEQIGAATTEFWLESNTITPDNNGRDDLLRIHYQLPESGFIGNLRIYYPSGKLVSSIASNTVLGTEGVLIWDGTNNEKQLVPPGIYLLFIEYYGKKRPPSRTKMAIVVGN